VPGHAAREFVRALVRVIDPSSITYSKNTLRRRLDVAIAAAAIPRSRLAIDGMMQSEWRRSARGARSQIHLQMLLRKRIDFVD